MTALLKRNKMLIIKNCSRTELMMLTLTLENTSNSSLLPLTSKEREEKVLMEFLNINKERPMELVISP
jgi:hypothetical protein